MNMKKSAFTLLCLLAFSALAVQAADPVSVTVLENGPERILVNYRFADFSERAIDIGGETWSEIRLGSESLMKIPGAPALPDVSRSLIIPDDRRMTVRVLDSEWYEVSGIRVAPSRGFILRTVDPASVPYSFGKIYGSSSLFPAAEAQLGEPYILRDHRGVVLTVNPFRYSPALQLLRVCREMTVELAALGPALVNPAGGIQRRASASFEDIYRTHFINYRQPEYTPLDEEGGMLIICHDDWIANVQPLVTHKNSIGISTTVVGVSTIGNNSTSIKNHIQSVYDSSDLAFVLLVGDGSQVDTPTASGGSSDPTYSKLAGGDNYPDILVGRFSAGSAADVETQVQRTIDYETGGATTAEWYWKGMGVASNQGPGDDNEYDNVHIGNIRDELLAHGYTSVDQIYDPSGTASQVSFGLNEGRGIINYCGHGSTTSWGSTGFSNSNVNALTNQGTLPFIFSVACVNGDFDGPTCFGEAWLRATDSGEPTGAVGAYMSSINQSWDPPMEAQDAFNFLVTGQDFHSYGALCFGGSCSMMDEYGGGGVEMFNTWIVFGDPSLQVIGSPEPPAPAYIVTGPGPGPDNAPLVRTFDPQAGGTRASEFMAYGAPHFGVNVACGDLDGDGLCEIVTGPGPGEVFGPHVRGFDFDGHPVFGGAVSFMAYGTPRFGVNVACADFDGDGMDEIVTGAGPGAAFGPHVRGWNVDGGTPSALPGVSFFAYSTLKWGVNVAAGDIDGDGMDEIVSGAGSGAVFGPHVRGWNVDGGTTAAIPGVSFLAYATNQYGVRVACGDIDGDGIDEIVTAPGPGTVFGPHIRGWNYDGGTLTPISQVSFLAYPALSTYGATVAAADVDADGIDELITGPGPGETHPASVKAWNWDGAGPVSEIPELSFDAYETGYGVNVAGGRR
jgi:hypothetical protein